MCRVSTSIASFMIAMNNEVQTHQFVKLRTLKAKHSTEISRIVQIRIVSTIFLAEKGVAVNQCSYFWQSRDEIHHIFIDVSPLITT
uniref:AlNc14C1G122 protein n=1 Tax=Albugo laibachii Nc14 TaxID=890382 RepID=F0VYX1_9STRA|nr:AlNc14C1G122 [Albugo laibachii Nc14]|eukprot:CCA13986.1 AlNc14C1G122 [Albugo laibachii Nc14]